MRLTILATLTTLLLMGVVAHTVVLPRDESADRVVDAYFAVGDDPGHPHVAALMEGFRAEAERLGLPPIGRFADLPASGPLADRYRAAFAAHYGRGTGRSLTSAVRLVWATDANPAREVQMALFRRWHLRTFGEPVDIDTDPSNRELTKAIVQSVAGAGPDVIEYIGGPDLRSLVDAGIALDITDEAEAHGFGVDTVFPAVREAISVVGEDGRRRQYAYPCNVDYRVLMYHRDLFDQAGVEPPSGGWTFEDMRRLGERVLASEGLRARPAFVCMNLSAYDVALAAGARLYAADGATHSVFDSPEAVAGLRAYRDLMYEHGAMPRPAEAASMSADTGFSSDVSGSAPGLFAQRAILMYVGGRWEYVTFAIANRDRVVVPAIDRRLADLPPDGAEARALREARARLLRDPLLPLTGEQTAAVHACLSGADRARLLHIEIAHVPTVTGRPYYPASARGAVINRALERDDPDRLVYAQRFLRFLGSEPYNEQINGTYDSICGRIEYCVDADGIAGPPAPLPGLEGFDSPVFAEAMLEHAEPWERSPYIGRTRQMVLVTETLERLQADAITPEEAAREIERKLSRQILANVRADAALRDRWTRATGGADPDDIDPDLRDADGRPISIRRQVESLRGGAGGGAS